MDAPNETKPQRIDFLTWLKGHGFNIDDMESKLTDEWQEFTHEVSDERVHTKKLGVSFKAKRNIDIKRPEAHTLVSDVVVAPIIDEGEVEKGENLKLVRVEQAELGPIRRDEVESHPFLKYPRNWQCFCGSGKKFKACHLNRLPQVVLKREAVRLKRVHEQMIEQFAGGKDKLIKDMMKQIEEVGVSDVENH